MVVGGVLAGSSEILVLVGFDKAEGDDAAADQGHGDKGDGGQILTDAVAEKREQRDDGAGAVADRGGNRELDIPQAEIADGHGEDIEHGDGQIGQNDLGVDLHALDEDLIGRVQTHHDADRHDHLEMAVRVVSVSASYF